VQDGFIASQCAPNHGILSFKFHKNIQADDREYGMRVRVRVGERAQIGGGICALIGILLRWLGPHPVPEVPIDPHQFAYVIIGMGVCLLVGGTLARWFARN
jgi:hypothetical protein